MNKLNALFLAVLFLVAVMIVFPLAVRAEIYKYVDKNGTTHFVDDLSKVPPEYRNQVTVSEEKPEVTPPEVTPPEGTTPAGEAPKAVEKKIETPEQARTHQMVDGLEEKKRLDEEKAREEVEKSLVTKVTIRGNQVLVPVTVGYGGKEVQASLLLDTGAERVVINRSIADQLDIPLNPGANLRVGGGRVINASATKLDYLRVGPYEVKDIDAWVVFPKAAPKEDGALGMNFLRGLEYSVDFENQVIRWKAQ
jgi:predicted aspartyl protease